MNIFDCFMYSGEDVILDIRLNYLNKYVDKFIIVEANYTHSGKKRKTLFNIKKFKKFKNKISYLKLTTSPKDLISEDCDDINRLNQIKILNAYKRENYQRNFISIGLKEANQNDIVIISDIDEIPKLENINLKNLKDNVIFFKQSYFYYRLNLYDPYRIWYGSKLCKLSQLVSPQWLRNLKPKKFNYWRLDVFFKDTKRFNNILIDDGGWHFSYLNNPLGIKKKLQQYLHHVDFELNPLSLNEISKTIQKRKAIYNLNLDKKSHGRFRKGNALIKFNINRLPEYILKNKKKFTKWIV